MTGHCNVQYLIEADGSVYPCDFYALDSYRLGKIPDNSIDELDRKRIEIRFIEESLEKPAKCKQCRWFALCRGGCKRDYTQGEQPHNYYCQSYQEFFDYAMPRLQQAAAFLLHLERSLQK